MKMSELLASGSPSDLFRLAHVENVVICHSIPCNSDLPGTSTSSPAPQMKRQAEPKQQHEVVPEWGCGGLQGMLDTVLEVSFTADQKHLLAAGGDQALRMWEITSGRVRHTLTGHTGKVLYPLPPLHPKFSPAPPPPCPLPRLQWPPT